MDDLKVPTEKEIDVAIQGMCPCCGGSHEVDGIKPTKFCPRGKVYVCPLCYAFQKEVGCDECIFEQKLQKRKSG